MAIRRYHSAQRDAMRSVGPQPQVTKPGRVNPYGPRDGSVILATPAWNDIDAAVRQVPCCLRPIAGGSRVAGAAGDGRMGAGASTAARFHVIPTDDASCAPPARRTRSRDRGRP